MRIVQHYLGEHGARWWLPMKLFDRGMKIAAKKRERGTPWWT